MVSHPKSVDQKSIRRTVETIIIREPVAFAATNYHDDLLPPLMSFICCCCSVAFARVLPQMAVRYSANPLSLPSRGTLVGLISYSLADCIKGTFILRRIKNLSYKSLNSSFKHVSFLSLWRCVSYNSLCVNPTSLGFHTVYRRSL